MNAFPEPVATGRSRRELEAAIAGAIHAVTRAQFVRMHALVELDGETLVLLSTQVDDNGVYWTLDAPDTGGSEWAVAAGLLADQPLMARVVRDHAPVRRQEADSGLHHCFYPVTLDDRVCGIVELKENHRPYPDEDRLISDFIALYINYVRWLARSDCDPLTGTLHGHLLAPAMRRILADVTPRGAAAGCGQCLVLLAVDRFAEICACYGPLFGDELQRRLAAELTGRLEADARVFRMAPDGFAVLLPARASSQAEAWFAGFLTCLADREFPGIGQLSVSVGLSQLVPGDTPEAVLARASRALDHARAQQPACIRRPGAR